MVDLLCLVYFLPWMYIVNSVPLNGQDSYKSTSDTIRKLFHEDNYEKRLRPFHNVAPLNVTVSMAVVHMGSLSEVDMDFSVDVFFRQYWQDPRLKHNLTEPILLPGYARQAIWLPDTFFLNVKIAKYHNVPADNGRITIYSDGNVSWSSRITMTANCRLDLRDYPLDEQSCNLTFLSYTYPVNQVDYFWKASEHNVIDVIEDEMNEFTLKDIKTRKTLVEYGTPDYAFTHLLAVFYLNRRLGYSFIQIYTPTVLIVMLSWLSFWISKDAVPARVALVVTTVLTIVTLMGSFRSSVPKVSYVKALDVFFIISLFFVFGAVLEYVIVRLYSEKIAKRSASDRDMVDIELMSQKRQDNKIYPKGHQTEKHPPSPDENVETIQRNSKMKNIVLKMVYGNSKANIIDRISRVLFPITFICFNIFYWSYYSAVTFGEY